MTKNTTPRNTTGATMVLSSDINIQALEFPCTPELTTTPPPGGGREPEAIFRDTALAYWNAGIPVIPLRPRSKIPSLNAWQEYATEMPDAETQARLLLAYPDGNVGLPLGPQSRMVAVDLDTDDPKVLALLLRIMPPVLWKRVGKKGAVYMFRYNGERSTRIKHEDGSMIVEILSRGVQVVLPPSIHPDTQRPYEANCELLDVADKLQPLPRDFEMLLRAGLTAAGFKLTTRGAHKVAEWVPAGGRDAALTSYAGLMARAIVKGERTLLEAVAEAELWVATFTEKVAGDVMDPAKARAKVMEFLRRDVVDGRRQLPKSWLIGMTPGEVSEAKTYLGQDIEEWDIDRTLDWLTDRFTEVPVNEVMRRGEIIDECLLRLIKSPSLGAVQQDQVFRFIHMASGKSITMASLRKRLIELSDTGIKGEDHTEIARALIKEEERYGEVRHADGAFYQWRGSHWVQKEDSQLLGVIAEEFGHLDAAKRHSDHRGILSVAMNLARRDLAEGRTPGINFANGYLTVDGELLDHDPKFGATYVMPYRYVPSADAPQRFMSVLDQSWGHCPDFAEKVQALREAIACTLYGLATKFSRAFLLVGVAHSGKSTIKAIVEGLVPADAVSAVAPHDWADKFLPTQMRHKLINFCGELSESATIAGDRFKSIVEGEELNGQMKGGQIFKFKPLCAQWFASNHLPRSRDTSAGFTRRWLMLQFDRPLSLEAKIVDLADQILDDEREAIVAWCLPAMQDLMSRQDFTLPASHMVLIGDAACQNNSVLFFLKAGGVRIHEPVTGQNAPPETAEATLHNAYYMFCKIKAGLQPVSLRTFRMKMGELQYEHGFNVLIESTQAGERASYRNVSLTNGKI